MSREDWYRNTDWTDEIRDVFFDRLSRSRSQRDQYLVIQAIYLAESCPEVSLELLDLYFETRTDSFHEVRAYDAKAEAYRRLGDVDSALVAYRKVLELEERFPGIKTNAFVNYPLYVAANQIRSEYENAVRVLEVRFKDAAFPVQRFEWHAAYALMVQATSPSEAALHARKAVEAAGETQSGFRYHQDLGLVGNERIDLLDRMREMSA